ncbi:MAG: ATP-dependent acyl-CoA ligase [Actinobacteria bacterium]|nr:ATP-dependent acyl-CoA ligase [Actinomycetota bacterium]
MTERVWIPSELRSLPGLLQARLESDPDSEYLDITGTKFSAADVADQAGRFAGALAHLGVQAGDRVATLMENAPEAMLSWWGCVLNGVICAPINSAYKGDYLRHQIVDSGSRVIVVQGDLASRVAAIAHECECLEHVIVVGEPDGAVKGPATHDWTDALAVDPIAPNLDVQPSDLATFIYTGGTTGPSKGCMLSHNYSAGLSDQISLCWRRTPDDVVWSALPLFHFNAISVCLVGALSTGGRAAVSGKFSVSGFWADMNRTGATKVSLLGSMAYLLASDEDRPEMPLSGAPEANTTLKLIGAAPMPMEIDQQLRARFGVDVFSGAYGLTEASLVSWSPLGVENRPSAAGVTNDEFFDVRIFDDDDNELPRNTDGEIVVRPKRPFVMFEGYWGNPEATVKTNRNYWYHTGDIGRIDDDSYLYFVDRKADYLRRRGENISSFDVEKIIMKHEQIVDVVVHAVPSQLTEDDLKLTATRSTGSTLTEEALFLWCVDELPYFALPRYVEFRDELPRSAVGRVLKRVLRDEGVTANTWDVEGSGVTYEKK